MVNNDANFTNDLEICYNTQNCVFTFFENLIDWQVKKKNSHIVIIGNQIINHFINNKKNHMIVKIIRSIKI